jgi:hypothetical protein
VRQVQSGHQISRPDFAVSQPIEQADYLIARHGFFDGGAERFEHEFDEKRRIGAIVGLSRNPNSSLPAGCE